MYVISLFLLHKIHIVIARNKFLYNFFVSVFVGVGQKRVTILSILKLPWAIEMR